MCGGTSREEDRAGNCPEQRTLAAGSLPRKDPKEAALRQRQVQLRAAAAGAPLSWGSGRHPRVGATQRRAGVAMCNGRRESFHSRWARGERRSVAHSSVVHLGFGLFWKVSPVCPQMSRFWADVRQRFTSVGWDVGTAGIGTGTGTGTGATFFTRCRWGKLDGWKPTLANESIDDRLSISPSRHIDLHPQRRLLIVALRDTSKPPRC